MSFPIRVWSALRAHAFTYVGADVGARGGGSSAEAGRRAEFGEATSPPGGGSVGRAATPHPVIASYYANLELPYGAAAPEVRAARRKLLKAYHPDRFPNDPDRARTAHALVQKLNEAHDGVLAHLEERYD